MQKVTGIGGIFFKCKDPAMIRSWYQKHLGINAEEYGFVFNWSMEKDPSKGSTVWAPFEQATSYLNPSQKDFMINYRVENLEELVKQLKSEGLDMLDELEATPYGKFVHLLDPEGNKIELWEATE